MKKYLYSVLILFIFTSPGISSDEYLEGGYYRPSLKSACNQVVAGFVLHTISGYGMTYYENNNAFGQYLVGLCRGIGLQLMVDGFFEFLHWTYHSTLNDFYGMSHGSRQSSNRGLVSHFINEVDERPVSMQLQHELYWNKTVNITRALTSLPFAVNCIALSLKNRAVLTNNFIFSRESLLCCEIVSTAYNLAELYQAYNQKGLRPGDIPSMGAISGLCKLASVPQVFSFYPCGSNWGPYTKFGLELFGNYQLYSFFPRAMNNIRILLRGKATVSIETVQPNICLKKAKPTSEQKISAEKSQIQSMPYKKRYIKKEKNLSREDVQTTSEENVYISDHLERSYFQSSQEVDEYLKPKEKIKTRGISNPPKNLEDSPKKSTSLMIGGPDPTHNNEDKRKNILGQVNELQKRSSVKEKQINILLNKTCQFIEGETQSIDGSEFAIVFQRGNKRISIKYETCHPDNVYDGFKLKRVLNAMETALMYNWDEQSIRQYMENHSITRFYRIPQNLLHVLWSRPDI